VVNRRHPSSLPLPLTLRDREARRARIREIGVLVAEGRYRVPAVRVADAILEFHRREDPD
jgi:hypothetical protein